MIWHILMSESVSVYSRYVVGLLSVWVRDCRSAVGFDSSTVLMIGFQSALCRLSIGLKSGDSIPNLTRNVPDTNPTGFTVSSATLSVADSWPTHWKFCGFCRFRVGLAGVTGVLPWLPFYFSYDLGPVMEVRPSCSLVLRSLDNKTRFLFGLTDSHTSMARPIMCTSASFKKKCREDDNWLCRFGSLLGSKKRPSHHRDDF